MKLIGLVGFKQSGKSTAAKYLEEKYGFVRHNMKDALIAEIKQNFPDLLREIANETYKYHYIYSAVPVECIEQLFDEKPPLMRALMVNYGTEVRRREDPDYWVHHWKLGVPALLAEDEYNIVTDDIRFVNEAQAIKGWNGKLIRIVRTDITTGGDHSSETEQLQIEADYTIEVGPGEQEKLYAALDALMEVGSLNK